MYTLLIHVSRISNLFRLCIFHYEICMYARCRIRYSSLVHSDYSDILVWIMADIFPFRTYYSHCQQWRPYILCNARCPVEHLTPASPLSLPLLKKKHSPVHPFPTPWKILIRCPFLNSFNIAIWKQFSPGLDWKIPKKNIACGRHMYVCILSMIKFCREINWFKT